jgi:hypothetical protein
MMQSTAANSQLDTFAATSRAAVLAGMGLVSFGSLLLELALTRLFSVVLFYHFAFLAISIALLGLGAGGVFAYLRRDSLLVTDLRRLAARLMAVNAAVIVVVLELVLRVPVALRLEWSNFARLSVIYLAAAAPFFFTGLLFSVAFAREREHTTQLYGADLLGGAIACLTIVPLLNWIGGPNAVLCSAIAMAVASAVWAEARAKRKRAFVLAGALVVLVACNHSGRLIDIVYAKGERRDQPWMEFAKWNAISRVEVDQLGEAKYVVIDADASTAIMNVDPSQWGQSESPDGGADKVGRSRVPKGGYNWRDDLMSAPPSIANVLRPHGSYAIIGPGGGVDVLRAVANGSPSVTGIEINPIIATTIMRGRYADYAHHLYELPQVHIHVSDGRSWLRASQDRYDVVQMTLVDTWASTAAGAFALSENNLYTLEAFREYFDHLQPDGIIAITRWEFKQPREALRVMAQEIAVLSELGVEQKSMGSHFMVVSDGTLSQDGRPVTVLAKKTSFTAAEEEAISEHLSHNRDLAALFTPGDEDKAGSGPVEANAHAFARLAAIGPAAFAAVYPYDVSTVSDNAPFFFFTFKARQALRGVLAGTGRGMDWKNNLGVVVLGMVLLISVAAVLGFLILPLALTGGAHHTAMLPLLYFVAVGLGYIMVEIAMIQRFVLFLGHPTYALTVVVFLMLLASGAGSLVSRYWMAKVSRAGWLLAAIAVATCGYVLVLPRLLPAMVGLPFGAKVFISGGLLVPLAFLMGMPFPTGLRLLGTRPRQPASQSGIEWAWAMNAASSVLGSVLAVVVAIHFGLNATLGCAAAAYLAAWLLMPALRTV